MMKNKDDEVSQMLQCHKALFYFSTLNFESKGTSFMQSLINLNTKKRQDTKRKQNKNDKSNGG